MKKEFVQVYLDMLKEAPYDSEKAFCEDVDKIAAFAETLGLQIYHKTYGRRNWL